jgi:ABC-type amino acid transport substrate-binding protein
MTTPLTRKILCGFFSLCAMLALADTTALAADNTLRVVTKPIEPFVMTESDAGFSLDLLQALGKELGKSVELYRVNSVSELLDEVSTGKADLGIAGITINAAREKSVDFSQPMYESGLQILVPVENATSILSSETLLPLLEPILLFFLVIVAASHLVWWTEHKTNSDFAPTYRKGLWDAIWWSTVTVTTVGYGDKTPKRVPGRIVGMIWMVSGFFIMAFLVGSVTSTLTVQSLRGTITGPADLPGKVVGTVSGTTSESYLTTVDAKPIGFENIGAAYAALTDGSVQAIVYDAPVLQYFVASKNSVDFKLAGKVFRREDYGIAFPAGSPLREEINVALLGLRESGKYDEIRTKWFGAATE